MVHLGILLLHLSGALALNILLSTTDSWASMNSRFLYKALKEEGHEVKFVAPLYGGFENPSTLTRRSGEPQADGGDFGHLLPVHQTYYMNLKRLNRVKGVLKPEEIESQVRVVNDQYGQDPQDGDVWYVNLSPLETLKFAFDKILPNHYEYFRPDLVIVGPNAGIFLSNARQVSELQEMLNLIMDKDIPILGLSLEDDHQVYFQDENFFHIADSLDKSLKKNVLGKNIKFVNERVIQLLKSVSTFPLKSAVSVNFPSINHVGSRCYTSSNSQPAFHQVTVDASEKSLDLARSSKKSNVKNRKRDRLVDDDDEHSTFIDKESKYYLETVKKFLDHELADSNSEELHALENCYISVTVENIDKGIGLGPKFWNFAMSLN